MSRSGTPADGRGGPAFARRATSARHAARGRSGGSGSQACSASTCDRPRWRSASFQATVKATSSSRQGQRRQRAAGPHRHAQQHRRCRCASSLTYNQNQEIALHKEADPADQRGGVSATRTGLGSAAPTKAPAGWCASTCAKARISRSTASNNLLRWQARSTAGLPCKGLELRSPLAVYRELLMNSSPHPPLIH